MNSLVSFDWEVALGDDDMTREEFESIAQSKVPLIKFRGKWIEVNRKNLQSILRLVKNAEKKGISLSTALKMKLSGEEEGISTVECDFCDCLDSVIAGEERFQSKGVPKGFNGKLRPYQEKGFAWGC